MWLRKILTVSLLFAIFSLLFVLPAIIWPKQTFLAYLIASAMFFFLPEATTGVITQIAQGRMAKQERMRKYFGVEYSDTEKQTIVNARAAMQPNQFPQVLVQAFRETGIIFFTLVIVGYYFLRMR